jgi:glutamate-1-semialdehyde 2,1-aminomutase
LLIFDEVISGFRLGPGGAAEHYGITPDLATFGKVIGGGMPVGAFGGPRALMSELAPLGAVYQAGTLSGNPVAMAAGLATLQLLRSQDGWKQLEARGQYLEQLVTECLHQSSLRASLARLGSMFWISWLTDTPPRSAEAIPTAAAEIYAQVFHGLLQRGVALAPSAYEIGFVSLAHQSEDIEQFVATLSQVLANLQPPKASGGTHGSQT